MPAFWFQPQPVIYQLVQSRSGPKTFNPDGIGDKFYNQWVIIIIAYIKRHEDVWLSRELGFCEDATLILNNLNNDHLHSVVYWYDFCLISDDLERREKRERERDRERERIPILTRHLHIKSENGPEIGRRVAEQKHYCNNVHKSIEPHNENGDVGEKFLKIFK